MQTVRASKKWLGLGVLACALCCAAPIAAVLGIGGATAVAGALLVGIDAETVLCLGVFGTLLVGAGYLWFRSRGKKAKVQSCSTSCNTDASCCDEKSNPSIN